MCVYVCACVCEQVTIKSEGIKFISNEVCLLHFQQLINCMLFRLSFVGGMRLLWRTITKVGGSQYKHRA